MKIPIWCKGKDGKWYRFPYEQLETLPDGRLGFSSLPGISGWLKTDTILEKLCKDTGWDTGHFFDYEVDIDAYILKEEPE